jgi:prevent-host-death family protein
LAFVIKKIDAFQAKAHLSRLLDEVAGGETIYINKHGKRVAELRPPGPQQHTKAKFGCAKGPGFYMAPEFDEPLKEFKEYM